MNRTNHLTRPVGRRRPPRFETLGRTAFLGVFRKIIFWNYGRTSWQYDVLAVLILAFVFLTPPAWFSTGKPNGPLAHQNGVLRTTRKLFIRPENLPAHPGTQDFERQAQTEVGRSGVKVTRVQTLRGEGGQVAAYEVDIE